jgi:DNA-binding helix-hairpin-helix protein with protein kinase domain
MARTVLRKADRGAAPVPAPALLGTLRGDAYQLGAEVGSGGEGVIHAVARRPELLAKLYRRAPSRFDVEKLDALVRATTPDLLSVAAWPTDCLKNGAGAVVGFVMPRVLDGRPLYELYSPRSRVQHFPSADFRFLVHVAANIARLFAAVHQAGFIMGDVNHGNILVRNDGTVAAVDCDSFQVGDGARFPCPVGTELFLAPELAGQNLWAVPRTANHAAFGLAVLLFHLVFMGRHPFAGRFLGAGEMPIEKAIAECRFAYSRDARRTRMAPPPFTPPLSVAGPATADLFERALHQDGRRGGRPSAEEWLKALDALKGSLVVCGAVSWHQYASGIKACPWCAIEQGSKAKLFGGVVRIPPAALADVQTLWARYLQIADPGPPRPLPREEDWVPPPKVRQQRLVQRLAAAGIGVAAVGSVTVVANPMVVVVIVVMALLAICALRHWPWVTEAQRTEALGALKRAEQAWHAAAQEWQAKAKGPDLSGERQALEDLKAKIDALTSEREARLKALARSVPEAEQRARYLGHFRIEDAGLHNIGPARCAVLRSWGIDTAAEVDAAKIAEIPGFGRNLTDRLVNWRWGREQNFKFMPLAIADPMEVQRLDRELAARRIRLMKALRAGIAELDRQMNQITNERAALWGRLEVALNNWMVARYQARVGSEPKRG